MYEISDVRTWETHKSGGEERQGEEEKNFVAKTVPLCFFHRHQMNWRCLSSATPTLKATDVDLFINSPPFSIHLISTPFLFVCPTQ